MAVFPQSRTTLPGLEAPVHISTQRSSEVSSVSPPSKAVKFRTHMRQQKQQGIHVTHASQNDSRPSDAGATQCE